MYFADGNGQANYELRLYEGQTRFDVIYGTVLMGTAAPQLECSRTTAPLTSTSATAQVVRLLADKAISCKPAARRQRRRPAQVQRLRQPRLQQQRLRLLPRLDLRLHRG